MRWFYNQNKRRKENLPVNNVNNRFELFVLSNLSCSWIKSFETTHFFFSLCKTCVFECKAINAFQRHNKGIKLYKKKLFSIRCIAIIFIYSFLPFYKNPYLPYLWQSTWRYTSCNSKKKKFVLFWEKRALIYFETFHKSMSKVFNSSL